MKTKRFPPSIQRCGPSSEAQCKVKGWHGKGKGERRDEERQDPSQPNILIYSLSNGGENVGNVEIRIDPYPPFLPVLTLQKFSHLLLTLNSGRGSSEAFFIQFSTEIIWRTETTNKFPCFKKRLHPSRLSRREVRGRGKVREGRGGSSC